VPLELEEFWAAELLQAVQRIPKTLAREVAGGGLFWAEKALGGLHALVSSRRRRS
jgi:hypothetical protein